MYEQDPVNPGGKSILGWGLGASEGAPPSAASGVITVSGPRYICAYVEG